MHSIRVFGLVGVFRTCRSCWGILEFSELTEFVGAVRVLGLVGVLLGLGVVGVLGVFSNICYYCDKLSENNDFNFNSFVLNESLDQSPFFQSGPFNICGNSFLNFANKCFYQLVKSLPPV